MKTTNRNIGDGLFTVAPHRITFNGLDKDYTLKTKRKDYPQKGIHTIKELLTARECEALVKQAGELGFQQAGLAIGQDIYRVKESTRNNKRVIFEDEALAASLWQRMGHLAPDKCENRRVSGLNQRFRVYEYPTGGIFAPHVDERMDLGGGKLTLFTFMVYLNDDLGGGETTFFDRRRPRSRKLIPNRIIRPKTGMALMFDHLLFHEGSIVTKGKKYVLRSDVVYRK